MEFFLNCGTLYGINENTGNVEYELSSFYKNNVIFDKNNNIIKNGDFSIFYIFEDLCKNENLIMTDFQKIEMYRLKNSHKIHFNKNCSILKHKDIIKLLFQPHIIKLFNSQICELCNDNNYFFK